MKKLFSCLPYAVWILFLSVSCSRQAIEGNDQKSLSGQNLAIEMQADYSLLTYDRLLDENTDKDFIDETVLSAMSSKSVYQYQASLGTKSADGEIIDTLRTSEEIPFLHPASLSSIFTAMKTETD